MPIEMTVFFRPTPIMATRASASRKPGNARSISVIPLDGKVNFTAKITGDEAYRNSDDNQAHTNNSHER